MALTFVGKLNTPTYIALSTDIASNSIPHAIQVGGTVFLYDTGTWMIIEKDLTLSPFSSPSVTTVPSRSLVAQQSMSVAMSVAGAYTTGDFCGTSAAPISFPNCSASAGTGGYILGATLIDKAKQSIAGELWLFNTTVTPPTDNAAWTLTDSDMSNLVCVIPFSTYYASVDNSVSVAQSPSGPARFVCGAAVQTLFGCYVVRGSATYTTGDLIVKLSIVQD